MDDVVKQGRKRKRKFDTRQGKWERETDTFLDAPPHRMAHIKRTSGTSALGSIKTRIICTRGM